MVAKGAGEVAAKIREKAAEAGVPLVQDIPLARALHASCEIGQEIPPSCSPRSPRCWRSSCTSARAG